jgi:cysteinyl-tRNA synthetase
MKYLGETLDIHGGGPDLIFPHHENEKAQSEGATGKPFVKYWMHVGYLNIDQQKMSKSLGNFLTVRDIRKTVDPLAVRFFMLSAHYRSPLNYSAELLQQAQSGLERLNNVVYNLRDLLPRLPQTKEQPETETTARLAELKTYKERFVAAMDDDFNTADALAVLFDLARETNTYLKNPAPARSVVAAMLDFFMETGAVLGFFQEKERQDAEFANKVNALLERRQAARKTKDWATADAIRDELAAMGVIVEDTPQGPRWRRK